MEREKETKLKENKEFENFNGSLSYPLGTTFDLLSCKKREEEGQTSGPGEDDMCLTRHDTWGKERIQESIIRDEKEAYCLLISSSNVFVSRAKIFSEKSLCLSKPFYLIFIQHIV